jgi:hypothetical protein
MNDRVNKYILNNKRAPLSALSLFYAYPPLANAASIADLISS